MKYIDSNCTVNQSIAGQAHPYPFLRRDREKQNVMQGHFATFMLPWYQRVVSDYCNQGDIDTVFWPKCQCFSPPWSVAMSTSTCMYSINIP